MKAVQSYASEYSRSDRLYVTFVHICCMLHHVISSDWSSGLPGMGHCSHICTNMFASERAFIFARIYSPVCPAPPPTPSLRFIS
jgi:hypothetical protein